MLIPKLQVRNIYTPVMILHNNKHYQVLKLTNNLFSQSQAELKELQHPHLKY